MLSMTINGNIERAKERTLNIRDNINAKSTASFTVQTDEELTVGQEVLIYDDLSLIFGGTIESYSLSYLMGIGGTKSRREYRIKAVDYNQIADRRQASASYVNKTISYIVNDLVNNFMDGENITIGIIAKGDTVIKQAVFNYIRVSDALNYLRDAAGGNLNWNIDYNKELTFFQRSDNAGTGFTDANTKVMTIEETRRDYRNRQLIRAGDGTTEVQVKEKPTPEPDGVSRNFSVRFPIATSPTVYINDVQVSNSDVGVNGLDKNKKFYWNKNSRVVIQDQSETVLTSSDKIEISYQGLKPIVVQADDAPGQNNRAAIEGGTGIYTEIEDQKQIDDKDAAFEYANGLLKRFGKIPRTIKIECDSIRKAGELVQVQSSNLIVNEDFLITDVSIQDFDGCGTLRYNITGASGEDVGTWKEFFRKLLPKGDLNIRENEILIRIQYLQENYGISGNTNVKRYNALYPYETLYPSETLYPNTLVQEEYNIED